MYGTEATLEEKRKESCELEEVGFDLGLGWWDREDKQGPWQAERRTRPEAQQRGWAWEM